MAFLQILSLDDERYNAYHDWRSNKLAMQDLRDYLEKGLVLIFLAGRCSKDAVGALGRRPAGASVDTLATGEQGSTSSAEAMVYQRGEGGYPFFLTDADGRLATQGLFWYPCRLCEYVRELKEAKERDPNMTVIKSNYTVQRSTSDHLVTNIEQMARPVPRMPTNQEVREANHPEWKKRKYAHRKEPLTRREQIHRDMLIRLQPKYSRLDMPQKIRKGYEKE
ncbi:hypothetical protein CYMTET_46334 [Cymbomonas tetramitiformis]|uniref:Uncharacterized protein n=1 Tax=Cymbomonas tetramitiformis TaxID=36881 RepID=A0AAE0EYT5_9CHLO|nr:hypothetical protein CYMTET_46334 [Cymbomonas tetramitiformis]